MLSDAPWSTRPESRWCGSYWFTRLAKRKKERWGVQCAVRAKEIEPSKISGDLISADKNYPVSIVNHNGISHPNPKRLDVLYFVTSADRDVKAQKALENLSNGREEQGKSRLEILFWDDIEDLLFKHQRVYACYYPDIFSFAVEWHGRYRGQAALELGFKGSLLCGHRLFSLKNRTDNLLEFEWEFEWEFENFRRDVKNLVEARSRLSSVIDTNDTLSTLAVLVGESGSPLPLGSFPDLKNFVAGGSFLNGSIRSWRNCSLRKKALCL